MKTKSPPIEPAKKFKHSNKNYPAIPWRTFASLIGPERARKIERAVLRKYGTKTIIVEFREVNTIRVKSPTGPLLGSVESTEKWANRFLKKDK